VLGKLATASALNASAPLDASPPLAVNASNDISRATIMRKT
jgi:hypothetical protein